MGTGLCDGPELLYTKSYEFIQQLATTTATLASWVTYLISACDEGALCNTLLGIFCPYLGALWR